MLFGFCYIPPSDSQYYSHISFSSIQEKLKTDESSCSYCIIGDLNARFGKYARELPRLIELPDSNLYSYPVLADDVQVPNDNAFILSTICKESGLLLVNNLKTPSKHFLSNKTYRKGNDWLSELDTCLVSTRVLSDVREFSVINNISLPSDHAPISLRMSIPDVDIECLSSRAQYLGGHTVLYGNTNRSSNLIKPIMTSNIDERMFLNHLAQRELPAVSGNMNEFAQNVTDLLYQCASISRFRNNVNNLQNSDGDMGRWERLLNDNDDVRIWRAINWKGEYNKCNNSDCYPTDDEFKHFYESNLNPQTNLRLADTNLTTNVHIPILDDEITDKTVKI